MAKIPKQRVDELLVEQGLAGDLAEAAGLVRAGRVHGADRRYEKPGESVRTNVKLSVKGREHPYVGRGGLKLAGALDRFGIEPTERACLDLGASTGGFTDCLLQRGARGVLAIDVGRGQLHERLIRDPRVTSREQTHLKDLKAADMPPELSLVVADLSFISLRACIPMISALLPEGCEAILLVKPQFELPPGDVPEGGVVTDEAPRRKAVEEVLGAALEQRFVLLGAAASPVAGADGNREFFVYLKKPRGGESGPGFAVDDILADAFN
ncbi:TlyA family RNA methyltransferase [bacterium]|nr:TlyA family RNA methyltransferase [bacterium]